MSNLIKDVYTVATMSEKTKEKNIKNKWYKIMRGLQLSFRIFMIFCFRTKTID